MRTEFRKKITKLKIRDEYVVISSADELVLELTIEFENGYKITYPLNETKGIKTKALAVVRLFDILEIKKSTELIGKEVRILNVKRNDNPWTRMGIGHVNKDRFMPIHRGDCTCGQELLTEKIILGKTW